MPPGGYQAVPTQVPKKTPKKVTDLTDPKHNPYPNSPSSKFVNGQWRNVAAPAQKKSTAAALLAAKVAAKKKGQPSAFDAWFNKATPGGAAGGPQSSDFDPLAGMPKQPGLTAYPTLDALPDGSDVADTPARAFARGKASLVDPKQYADLVGRKSYQPVIDALTSQQSRLGSGVSDANGMLDRSYGDASAASLRGADVVRNSNAQANQSLTDLAARMAQAAGGDPLAAAAVGQATANTQAADTRFADVAAQGQADQAAAAQRDLGTQKLAYKGVTDKAIADLATSIGQAKTEGGQAQGKAIMDALGFNDQQKTSQLNRDVAGQEAWLAGQIAGPQITAANLANEGTRAGMKINAHNAKVNDWTTINTATRQKYLDSVTKWTNKNVAQQMKMAMEAGKTPAAELALADPKARAAIESDVMGSMLSNAGPLANPAVMYKTALTTMKNAYPDSSPAAIKKLAQLFVSKQVPAWNSYHGEGQAKSGKTWKFVNGGFALVKV